MEKCVKLWKTVQLTRESRPLRSPPVIRQTVAVATPDAMAETYPLPVRACFTGSLVWSCPACGLINRSRLRRDTYRVRCRASDCRRRFGFGLRVLTLDHLESGSTRDVIPRDWETFPRVPAVAYVPAIGAHEVVHA